MIEEAKLAVVARMQENFSMPNVYGIISFTSYKTKEEAEQVLQRILELKEIEKSYQVKCVQLEKLGDENKNYSNVVEQLRQIIDSENKYHSKLRIEIEELKNKIRYHVEVRASETVFAVWRRELLDLIK